MLTKHNFSEGCYGQLPSGVFFICFRDLVTSQTISRKNVIEKNHIHSRNLMKSLYRPICSIAYRPKCCKGSSEAKVVWQLD